MHSFFRSGSREPFFDKFGDSLQIVLGEDKSSTEYNAMLRSKLKDKLSDNSEVASTPANTPEEARVLGLASVTDDTVGGNHCCGDQLVNGEAMHRAKPAVASSYGQSRGSVKT